jgi:phage gp29-like protein
MAKKRASAITPSRVQYAIRNRFNPIRDFTPEKLVQQLDLFHAGELKDAARLWETMERRDPNLGNVAAKRKKSVARLSWQILTKDDGDAKAGASTADGGEAPQKSDAEMQAEFLQEFYGQLRATSVLDQNETGGLRLLVRQMMDAIGKKYAVHEIVWVPPGALDGRGIPNMSDVPIAEFRFCPLWWFENKTGRLRFLPEEHSTDGVEMPAGEWLVSVGEGIMESCSVMYVFKHMPLKDWVAFSEKFGMPGVLGKTNAAKDSAEWEAMEEAVAAFGQDWAAVCSANDILELVEVKAGGNNLPFPPLVEYCDRNIAARWRGADLSTISQGKEGVGASLQGDETNLLLEDDAEWISEILNEQVTRYALEWKFGKGVQCLAYVQIQGEVATPQDEQFRRDVVKAFMTDRTVVDVIANLTDLKKLVGEVGLPVFEEYTEPFMPVVAEEGPRVTGETVKDAEGDIVGGDFEEQEVQAGPGAGEEAAISGARMERAPTTGMGNTAARREFALATKTAFKEVARRLQAIHSMQNEAEQRVAFQDFLNALPALKKLVNSEAAIADQVTALTKALENGFLKGARTRRTN